MKIDKKLLKYCIYAGVTVILIYIGIAFLNNIGNIFALLWNLLKRTINLAKPFFMALIIVYLLKPGVESIEKFLEKKKILKKASHRRAIGIIGVYTLVAAIFAVVISGIYIMIGGKLSHNASIGEMTNSIVAIVSNIAVFFIAIVLYFIGIDYALGIGIIAGICNMIPYIEAVVGTVLAVIMALLSGQPITAVWAIIGMLAVRQVDDSLLAPKIVGNSVGLHPVFTMIAIFVGGNLGGLIGMLVAVPTAASLKILLGKWYVSHMEKATS